MGCWSSKDGLNPDDNRITRWRSTGIVALRDAKLKSIPGEILHLENSVRTLDLTNNKIVEVAPEISKLINMQRLILANNCIERLPTTIGVLRSLKVLTIDGNNIANLPDELCSLSKLEKLSVVGNSLSSLPKNIGQLYNLVLVNVSNNKLSSLPESIGGCISLEELQANGNFFVDLPSSVCTLSHLKFLSLNNNKIKQLPSNLLKDCKALQSVSLHDNPISMDTFQQMDGFPEFEERRKKKCDKQIDSNVMLGPNALDEGVDLRH